MSDESAITRISEFNPGPDWVRDPAASDENAKVMYETWNFHSPAEDADFAERAFHARYTEFVTILRMYPELEIHGATIGIGAWPHGFEVTAKVTIKRTRKN